MNDAGIYNVIFAICYAVSAVASVIMIIVTCKNYRHSVDASVSGAESNRFFENVVMYAMEMAEDTKHELVSIIHNKQQKIKSGHVTTEIQKDNDEIQKLFLLYKRDVSSRLKIFDVKGKKINQFWEKMDNDLADIIGSINPQKQATEMSSVYDLFDNSVHYIKHCSKGCK